MSYTDPSGYGFFSEILQFQHTVDPVARGFDNILAKSSTLQSIGGVAAGVASVYFGPWVAAAYSAHLTNIQGGSTGDIVKAGAIAGAAGYASQGVAASDWGVYGQISANIAIGTAAGVASGADFDDSFYASAFTAAASAGTAGITDNQAAGAIIAASIGGTASEISGGKFANGAVTGAFGYMMATSLESAEQSKQSGPVTVPDDVKYAVKQTFEDHLQQCLATDINQITVVQNSRWANFLSGMKRIITLGRAWVPATTQRDTIYLNSRITAEQFFASSPLVLHEYYHVIVQWNTGQMSNLSYILNPSRWEQPAMNFGQKYAPVYDYYEGNP